MLGRKEIDIESMADGERGRFYLGSESPIGNNLFKILEVKYATYIYLYPLNTTKIAGFTRRNDDTLQIFINTSLSKSYQIFAAAHELYHLINFKNTQENEFILCHVDDISEDIDTKHDTDELSANYFAACFLLPRNVIRERFDFIKTRTIKEDDVVLEIIKLQCEYEVPYKTIIRRLIELKVIDDKFFDILLSYESKLFDYCKMLDSELYDKMKDLESASKRKYHSLNIPKDAADVYRDGLLSYNKLEDILYFYDKVPEDFNVMKPTIKPFSLSDLELGDDEDE